MPMLLQKYTLINMNIRNFKKLNILLMIICIVSFCSLFVELDDRGTHAFQSIQYAFYATPSIVIYYVLLIVIFAFHEKYFILKIPILIISFFVFIYEFVFIVINYNTIFFYKIWGWFPCHFIIAIIALINICYFFRVNSK